MVFGSLKFAFFVLAFGVSFVFALLVVIVTNLSGDFVFEFVQDESFGKFLPLSLLLVGAVPHIYHVC